MADSSENSKLWRLAELNFNACRSEILERIKLQTQLLSIKMITLSALFAFVFRGEMDPTNLQYFVWMLPIVSMVFDFAIFQNVIILNCMGLFIAREIEKKWIRNDLSESDRIIFWEDFFGKIYSSWWDFFRRFTAFGISLTVTIVAIMWFIEKGQSLRGPIVTYVVFWIIEAAMIIRSLRHQSHSRAEVS